MILFFVMVAMLMIGGKSCETVNLDRKLRLRHEKETYDSEVANNLRDDTGYVENAIEGNWEYVC